MAKLKKQHIVPVFYLKGFVNPADDPYIWMYEKGNREIRKVSVKDAAVHSNYYSFEREDGTTDKHTFEEGFSRIEETVAPSIKKVLNNEPINNEERSHISVFMALSFLRVPSFRNGIKKVMEAHHKEMTIHQARDKESFEKMMKKIQEETGEDFGDIEKLREEIIEGKYGVEIDNYRSLGLLLNSLTPVADAIHALYWNFLIAPRGGKFVTCDNPFFYINPLRKLTDQKGTGLWTEHTEITFPLSKDIAILAMKKNQFDKIIKVNKNKVGIINMRTVISADRFIYSSRKSNKLLRLVIKYQGVRPVLKEEYFHRENGLLSAQTREIVTEP